ncbi:MAG TPA: HAMP domain-containing sensor histidine kinase [Polyangiaceae bacterium]|jgi:signal transduction histidine kinase|nr:HAMP domain-containing sensor histidine kinase [Polyangiaceae bacterium]
MGAITLEASLRRRLLLLVLPVTFTVGVAAVAVTSHMLERADRDAARAEANELLLQLDAELAEGDAPALAAAEVLQSHSEPSRARIRRAADGRDGWETPGMPSDLASLAPGDCASASVGGHAFLACAARRGEYDAIVALSVDAQRAITLALAEWMLAIVLLATLGAIFAARFAVRAPLGALNRLVKWSEVVARGDGRTAPDAGGIAEFHRLATALEALVGDLVEARDRERATSGHIAHELRTPLTSLRAELETLATRGGEPVQAMLADVDRLAQVIDSILVLSAPPTPMNAGTVVNLADLARELAGERTRVDAPEEALVEGDAQLAELALRNLLENAEKYSGSPARVVRITREASGIRVAVIDDGPGLGDDARSRMFDRHWRGGTGAGTGLGLALVRAVAERHGGSVAAQPNAGAPGLEVSMTFGNALGWHPATTSGENPAPG